MSQWSARARAEFTSSLAAHVSELGLGLSPEVIESLADYQQLLAMWNRTHRLVGSAEPTRSVEEHFLDSLAVLRLLPADGDPVDIGSGAGFPGAVLAAAQPERAWTLVEPQQKRVAFLNAVRVELKLRHLHLAPVRSDALADATVDVLVSRATLPPDALVAEAARLLRPHGALVVMTARGLDADTRSRAESAGLRIESEDRWTLPSTKAPRTNTLLRQHPEP